MAVSQVGTFATSGSTTGSFTATLPQTATAGNVLFCVVAVKQFGAFGTVSTPSGWTAISNFAENSSGSTTCRIYFFYKVAAGSDSDPTISFVGQNAGAVTEEWTGFKTIPLRTSAAATDGGTASVSVGLASQSGDWVIAVTANIGGSYSWFGGVTLDTSQTPQTATISIANGIASGGMSPGVIVTGGTTNAFEIAAAFIPLVIWTPSPTLTAIGGLVDSPIWNATPTLTAQAGLNVPGTFKWARGVSVSAQAGINDLGVFQWVYGATLTAQAGVSVTAIDFIGFPASVVVAIDNTVTWATGTEPGPTTIITDSSNVELSDAIAVAFSIQAIISTGDHPAADNGDQVINYTAATPVDHTTRRLLAGVSVNLPTPTIINGKPMLPLVQGFMDSSMTVVTGPGHASAVPDPDPTITGVDPPPTKGTHNDGGGYAKWHVKDLPDPADYGGFYWLGTPTADDGSASYSGSGFEQWDANSHSTMPSAPSWHSVFPFKPGVTSHTWYGPGGNLKTFTKAVRFNTEFVEHMWIDMGTGDASSPPLTWVVIGLIQHFDFGGQTHYIMDSGKPPSASGITWGVNDCNGKAKLAADPSNYRMAISANHQRMSVFTSMTNSSKTLKVPFTHDYLPKMFFVVVDDANSVSGYQYPHGRRIKRGTLDHPGSNLRNLVLGRRNGVLNGNEASHMVVFEMRMWNRALDLDELDAQYDQLSSTWKFHQYY